MNAKQIEELFTAPLFVEDGDYVRVVFYTGVSDKKHEGVYKVKLNPYWGMRLVFVKWLNEINSQGFDLIANRDFHREGRNGIRIHPQTATNWAKSSYEITPYTIESK